MRPSHTWDAQRDRDLRGQRPRGVADPAAQRVAQPAAEERTGAGAEAAAAEEQADLG